MQGLRWCQDGRDWHAVRLSRLDQLIPGVSSELLADERSEFVKCLHPRSEHVKAVVLELSGFTQPGPQPVPLPR